MAKCSRCGLRKAKRRCPALGSDLCALCCGRLREKELRCPAGCAFLVRHRPYQENRVIRKKRSFSEEVPEDERLSWLTLNIEAPLLEAAQRNPGFADRDALLALEYAKEKVEKSRSRLILSPGREAPARNEAGEAVYASLDQCRFEKKIILPQDVEKYSSKEKLKCLDNVILGIKFLAKGDLAGRAYLQNLARRMERLKELSSQKKLLTQA
jgi:hypothetical protein